MKDPVKIKVADGFTVTAHSGAMGLPDNSIEAMQAGVDAGADIVEFDLTHDDKGELVLSHDKPKSKCVTLSEAFDFLAKNPCIRANVDVKETDHLEKLLPLAEEKGVLPQLFFTGLSESTIPVAREKCPGIPYYLNIFIKKRSDIPKAIEKTLSLGAVGVNINKSCFSERLVTACHQSGLLVSVWTVNDKRKAKKLLRLHADNVTSRKPDMIVSLTER